MKTSKIDCGACQVYKKEDDFMKWAADFAETLIIQDAGLLGFLYVAGYDGTQEFVHGGVPQPPAVKAVHHQVQRAARDPSGSDVSDSEDDQGGHVQTTLYPWSPAKIQKNMALTNVLLKLLIDKPLHVHLGKHKDVFHSWQSFKEHCGCLTPADFPSVFRAMYNCKMQDHDDPATFLDKFEEQMRQVCAITEVVYTDVHKALMLMIALPDSWERKMEVWQGKDSYIPYDLLKSKVTSIKQVKQPKPTPTGSALNVRTHGDASCAYCGFEQPYRREVLQEARQ